MAALGDELAERGGGDALLDVEAERRRPLPLGRGRGPVRAKLVHADLGSLLFRPCGGILLLT